MQSVSHAATDATGKSKIAATNVMWRGDKEYMLKRIRCFQSTGWGRSMAY